MTSSEKTCSRINPNQAYTIRMLSHCVESNRSSLEYEEMEIDAVRAVQCAAWRFAYDTTYDVRVRSGH